MINYTNRLDIAMRKAASAHEKQKHHRKGSDVPYIIHPFRVMVITCGIALAQKAVQTSYGGMNLF